jgi:hypothetical protein
VIKLLYRPVSILSGVLAGLLARRSFAAIWRLIDDKRPPQSDQRTASVPKLALALALEGAVFRAAKGLVDHASRRGFADFTGRWPGSEDSEQS